MKMNHKKEGDVEMYYFIGIKGAGMSSLAVILKQLGLEVAGSDVEKHFFTETELVKNNIPFYVYDAGNIKEGMTIIRGASIKDDHIEFVRAKELGLEILEYNEMVGKLTREFKTICVAGCHGKTTTTNMLSLALRDQGVSYLIGDGTGYASRDNKYFALESCEYQRHFLAYQPYYAIITNIDLDHVDYFKDIDDVIDAYTSYANSASKKVIAYGDDPYTRKMEVTKSVVFYGLESTDDVVATNVEYHNKGISFDVEGYGHFDLPLYGEHQLLDALAVITVCIEEKVPYEEVLGNLKEFKGARRRFTETVVGNNIIIDDYAHHPNEVKATIQAIRQKYEDKKLVIVFQPHTFSRTKEFADELVKVFDMADAAYLLEIHPAREKQEDYPEVTSDMIISRLKNGYHINMDEADKLAGYNNAVFAFMSPNDVSKLEKDLEELLK